MPPVAAVAAVGVGASIFGAVTSANAAGAGAAAAQGAASAQAAQAAATQKLAIATAAPTAAELSQISDRINLQQRQQAVQTAGLQRDTAIMNTLDPTIMTAATQMNNMMNGQQAAILAPMKQNQQFQLGQLKQQLAAQLGPGYATSSAGQQALQGFSMQANLQLQTAQMQAFNDTSQAMGFAMQQRTQLQGQEESAFNTASNMSSQTLQGMSNIQNRQVNAVTGSANAMQQTSGSQYAGQMFEAKAQQGFGQSIAGIGGTILGAAGEIGASLSGKPATPDDSPNDGGGLNKI